MKRKTASVRGGFFVTIIVMISWSLKRRLTYITIFLVFIAVVGGWFGFVNLYEPPSCFDGKQNDIEAGIDCGGACQYLCSFQVSEPVVLFSRSFEVVPGVYNAVAYVENPNLDVGNRSIEYTFTLYDSRNNIITERSGRTFIGVGQVSPIFEGAIETGDSIPTRTILELVDNGKWEQMRAQTILPFVVRNKVLENASSLPKVRAELENTSVIDHQDVEVVSVVFDANENAIATSRTFVEKLPKKSSVPIVFTWPQPFATELESCVVPVDVTLLFDVSGSMNNDSDDPPQPLTDAKEAAAEFVERLSPDDRASLVTFATDARVLKRFSNQHIGTSQLIRNIQIEPEEEVGSTNTGVAFANAVSVLLSDSTPNREDVPKVIVLLTDGIANEPEDPGGEEYAIIHSENAKEAGYTVYTIGLGQSVNSVFLRDIATTPESLDEQYYYSAATSKDLLGIYESINESICEKGPAIIDIIPRLR